MTVKRTADVDEPDREIGAEFRRDLVRGLAARPKVLPSKYFYDARGAELFDRICQLEEYYLTRTETQLMERHVGEMTALMGARCRLVEYGSGSSIKTQILLDHLHDPASYVPIDISAAYLAMSTKRLRSRYPTLEITPVVADYTGDVPLPPPTSDTSRTIVYFPGSTIGNFEPKEAADFLRHVALVAAPNGALLVGVDLKKDKALLESAYDDAEGVTAAFNLNVLARANRELGTDFDLHAFDHRALYNEQLGRIEMYLVSRLAQHVRLDGRSFSFEAGEAMRTEYSYKYSIADFEALASEAGFSRQRTWTDERRLFSIHYLIVPAS